MTVTAEENQLVMTNPDFHTAKHDFEEARRRAAMEQVLASLRGEATSLMPFEELRRQLGGTEAEERGLQEIPLAAVVGSVGRYKDFTRTFLPKHGSSEDRWARVKTAVEREGMPPITVYKLGDAYFVNDGNHRVSVARQRGDKSIQAYVTEIKTRVPLKPDDSPDEIICKARYAEFLEKTNLDRLRPQADLMMTFCGHYHVLLEQIEVQRYLSNLDPTREDVTYPEAVAEWYDRVYLPLVLLIRQQGLGRNFPERTETDLYVMVTQHRAEMRKNLDWTVDTAAVADDLIRRKESGPGRVLGAITPAVIEAGPQVGGWRRRRLARRPNENLFADILVAGRGVEADFNMVRHAAIVAKREESRLLALRILRSEEERHSEPVESIRVAFRRYCREMGIRGEFAAEVGSVPGRIVDRAAWVDLVALSLVEESGPATQTGYGSDFNTILQRSPRPVFVVPEAADSALDRGLLAYDGSPKADEALFAAAYFSARWGMGLSVVCAGEEEAAAAMARAQDYLRDQGVAADYIRRPGPVAETVLSAAAETDSNLLIMGGFGFRPFLQLLLGSTVNKVLAAYSQPIFIFR